MPPKRARALVPAKPADPSSTTASAPAITTPAGGSTLATDSTVPAPTSAPIVPPVAIQPQPTKSGNDSNKNSKSNTTGGGVAPAAVKPKTFGTISENGLIFANGHLSTMVLAI